MAARLLGGFRRGEGSGRSGARMRGRVAGGGEERPGPSPGVVAGQLGARANASPPAAPRSVFTEAAGPSRAPMGSPAAAPRLLYRSSRLLRAAFLQLHRQQQRADVFCDVVLRAEGEAVPAHCCVLSVCSPFFMEQLARELPPRGRRVVLELAGLKIGALRKLVDFLYTAELEASWEEAQEVLAAARQLRVAELESLQLKAGRLVKPGPSWRLNRGCLQAPRPAPGSATPQARPASPGAAVRGCGQQGSPPPEEPPPPGAKQPGCPAVGPVKLRKAVSCGCWEVVQEERCSPGPRPAPEAARTGPETPAEPRPVPAPAEVQPPPAGGEGLPAVGAAARRSPPGKALPRIHRPRKVVRAPPAARQGQGLRRSSGQEPRAAPAQPKRGGPAGGVPPASPREVEAEEIDVGTAEPWLPPGAVCVRPTPSSESDTDVDILS